MTQFGLKLITGPTLEPIRLADVQAHLRVDEDGDYISGLITTSRRMVEKYLDGALIEQSWQMWRDSFLMKNQTEPWWDGEREGSFANLFGGIQCREIQMPILPLLAIDSIYYYTPDDAETAYSLTNVTVDTVRGRIVLKRGSSWPTDLRDANAVRIDFKSGYGTTEASVPSDIRHAILLMAGHYYENRQASLPEAVEMLNSDLKFSIETLLNPYRKLRI